MISRLFNFFTIAIVIFCNSCTFSKCPESTNSYISRKRNRLIDSLINIYQQENRNAKFYCLIYDKKDDEEYRLTIVHSDKEIKNVNSFFLNKIDGSKTPTYLYTGAEEIFDDSTNFVKLFHQMNCSQSLSFIHTIDTAYLIKGDCLPFINLRLNPPTLKW